MGLGCVEAESGGSTVHVTSLSADRREGQSDPRESRLPPSFTPLLSLSLPFMSLCVA